MYDNTIKDKFIELRARHVTYDQIAADLKVNRTTALRWGQRYQSEIDALAAVQAEALRHKFYASRETEIEVLSKRLARLEHEIDQRNPQYMHTRELTDLIRATRARLDVLCVEPRLEDDPAQDNPPATEAHEKCD